MWCMDLLVPMPSTSRKSDVPTILKGNPTPEYISSDNNNGYVLSYKSTWGLGFYK